MTFIDSGGTDDLYLVLGGGAVLGFKFDLALAGHSVT
jgi:hypothetical protein